MVRFIINKKPKLISFKSIIYIPIWLDLLFRLEEITFVQHRHLHSNMVRFIIITSPGINIIEYIFTFQYGQIYYVFLIVYYWLSFVIYIPIWLDLLLLICMSFDFPNNNLHSNMVRFIILLDFLKSPINCHLHSNMVRFIIQTVYARYRARK